MPSAQVIDLNPNPRTEYTPLEQTLSSFSNRQRENQIDRQDTDALRDIYSQYQKEGGTIQDAIIALATRPGISPTKRVESAKQLNEFQKYNTELQKKSKDDLEKAEVKAKKAESEAQTKSQQAVIAKDLQEQRGFTPEQADAYAKNPALLEKVHPKEKVTGDKNKEKFEQTLATEAAKEVPKLEQTIAKSKDVLENIKTIEDLAKKNLSGVGGYLKAAFNTEAASQLKTLGATNLDTVIKLFNPAGTLPTAKLNWIRDTFSVSPWDNLSTIQGKLNTQKIISNQGAERSKERLRLLKKYNGNIPQEVDQQFDADTGSLLDVLKEQYESKPGFVKVKDPQGRDRWVPENVAKQLQGS